MGHRGAAGLALENTLDSFELAKILGVDSIELDIHISKDGKLMVIHDNDTYRVSNKRLSIKQSTSKQIQKVVLADKKSHVPTLEEVIKLTANVPLMIEIKSEGCIEALLGIINRHADRDITIASFKHSELRKLRKLAPNVKIYGLERTKPIEILQLARSLKLDGVGLNYWLLNPLTYWMSKRFGLGIYVYTINNRSIGNIIKSLYPNVTICTDYPEKFLRHTYQTTNTTREK